VTTYRYRQPPTWPATPLRAASSRADAAVNDLQETGVEVQRIPFIPGAAHQAHLHDPFGNFIELNQPE
jgi:hypothetical protein